MKYVLTFLMITIGLWPSTEPSTELADKYYIAFLANAESGYGHGFVAFGYESEAKQMTVSDGAWGLYPVKEGDMKSLIGMVPGKIKDDFMSTASVRFVKVVSKSQYVAALKVLKEWQNKDYQVVKRDCVTFVIEVAGAISLTVPDRTGLDNFPWRYIKTLKEAND